MVEFQNECDNEVPYRDPDQHTFYSLAKRYLDRCEAYDRRVCTARDKDGNAQPTNRGERMDISRNAMAEHDLTVRDAGITTGLPEDECRRRVRQMLWQVRDGTA